MGDAQWKTNKDVILGKVLRYFKELFYSLKEVRSKEAKVASHLVLSEEYRTSLLKLVTKEEV